MKNIEDLPEQIFDLLAEKEYAQLNDDQKKQVNDYMNSEEYDQYRLMIQEFQELDSDLFVEDKSWDTIKSEQASLPSKGFFNRVPLYKIAASFILAILTSIAVWNTDFNKDNVLDDYPLVEIKDSIVEEEISFPIELIDSRMEEMRSIVQSTPKKVGKSLAEENYPEGLVFQFNMRSINSANL